jgi:hypothetical protein
MNEVIRIKPSKNDLCLCLYQQIQFGVGCGINNVLLLKVTGKDKDNIDLVDLADLVMSEIFELLSHTAIPVSESAWFYKLRNTVTGEESSFIFRICKGSKDGLAAFDLGDGNSCVLIDLEEDINLMSLEDLRFYHDLKLGNNRAIVGRGLFPSDDFVFSLATLTGPEPRLVTYTGNYYNYDNQGPFASNKADIFWFNNGFVDKEYRPVSPFCFTAGSDFSEDLAAVCFSGKWGYINKELDFIIDPRFGYAEPFSGGFARVLLLHDEFLERKGSWTQFQTESLQLWTPWTRESDIPYPLTVPFTQPERRGLPERTFIVSDLEMNDRMAGFHDFSLGISNRDAFMEKNLRDLSRFGDLAIINRNGEVVYKADKTHPYIGFVDHGVFAVSDGIKFQIISARDSSILEEDVKSVLPEGINKVEGELSGHYHDICFSRNPFYLNSIWSFSWNGDNFKYSLGFGLYLYREIFRVENDIPSLFSEHLDFPEVIRENSKVGPSDYNIGILNYCFPFRDLREFKASELSDHSNGPLSDDEEYILDRFSSGMMAAKIHAVSERLKSNPIFIGQVFELNPFIAEEISKERALNLMATSGNFQKYLGKLASKAKVNWLEVNRLNCIPLFGRKVLSAEDVLGTVEKALEFVELFPYSFDYLNNELKNSLLVLNAILRKLEGHPDLRFKEGLLYAEVLLRKYVAEGLDPADEPVIAILSERSETMQILSTEYLQNTAFLLNLIREIKRKRKAYDGLAYINPSVFENLAFSTEVMSIDYETIKFMPEVIRGNRELMLKQIRQTEEWNWDLILQAISDSLRNDQEFWEEIGDTELIKKFASDSVTDVMGIEKDLPF